MVRSTLTVAGCLLAAPACWGLRLAKEAQSPPAFQQAAAYPQAAYPQGYPQPPAQGYQQMPYSQSPYFQQPAVYNSAYGGAYGQNPAPMAPGAMGNLQLPFEVKEAPGLVQGIKNLTAFVKRHTAASKEKVNNTLSDLKPVFDAFKSGVNLMSDSMENFKILRKSRQAAAQNITLSEEDQKKIRFAKASQDELIRKVQTSAIVGAAMANEPSLAKKTPMEKAVYQGIAVSGVFFDQKHRPLKL